MSLRAPPWAPPLLAVQFLTRLPVPWLDRLSADAARDGLARAMAWFPLVGAGIGVVTAVTFAAAGLLWPPAVAALLALAVEALLTGAFHEDAVADFCDAFGGTARGADALRIMRDSRIGSYGTLGLGLAVGLRLTAIVALPPAWAFAGIVAAASMGRLWAVLLAALVPPPPDGAGLAARIGSGLPRARVALAVGLTLPGVLALLWLRPEALLASAMIGVVFLLWLARFLRARIGGSTGDCLGFAVYMGQLTVLLAAAAA